MIYFWGKIPFVLDFLCERYCQSFICSEHTFDRRIKPLEYWNPTYIAVIWSLILSWLLRWSQLNFKELTQDRLKWRSLISEGAEPVDKKRTNGKRLMRKSRLVMQHLIDLCWNHVLHLCRHFRALISLLSHHGRHHGNESKYSIERLVILSAFANKGVIDHRVYVAWGLIAIKWWMKKYLRSRNEHATPNFCSQ